MAENLRIPPFRSLDIYRLVVVRRLKQCHVANSFRITPGRVSQVIRRVRNWVNASIGDWLFPGRDDLRFYVALEAEHIRVHDSPSDPELVVLVGPGWSYVRHNRIESECDWQPGQSTKSDGDFIAQLINSGLAPAADSPAVTPSAETDSTLPGVNELAHRVAELLIVWKKSQKLSAALKSPLRAAWS